MNQLLPLCLAALMVASGAISATPQPSDPQGVTIDSLRLERSRGDVTIYWSPPSSPPLRYYVYFGTCADSLSYMASTTATHFGHHPDSLGSVGFYRIEADYSVRGLRRVGGSPRRDDAMLLSFDEGDLQLESFSEGEDVKPDAWELSDAETLPDSGRSLRLYDNCWKRLTLDNPIAISDGSVWSIGALSIDGDTLADLQAFGFGDGQQQLFYTFHGMREVWAVPWVIANQDVNHRGEWHVYEMAVGYDWNIRYEYLPEITEFYFINDNDNNNPSAQLYLDQLTDVTESRPRQPQVQILWNRINNGFDPQVIGLGGTITFRSRVTNVAADSLTYRWDFGDGVFSDLANPMHNYPGDGRYSVALRVATSQDKWAFARSFVDFSDYKFGRQLTACFTGDVMLARRYEEPGGLITLQGPDSVFSRIHDRITSPDLTFINLECVLSDSGEPHPTKSYLLRGRPENVAGLTYSGVDFAGLANNHVYDYAAPGLHQTIDVLDTSGILHSGAGMNEYEALQPVFRTVHGLRIGLLAYCNRTGRDDNTRPYGDAAYDRYGFAYFSADNIQRSVPDAADQCDILVVYVHGGAEYATAPHLMEDEEGYPLPPAQWRFATPTRDSATIALEHMTIDLGADLVIGTHPHVLQGFEVYNGVVIAHSLGNFAFDQDLSETWPSALVSAVFTDEGVKNVTIEPIFVDNYRPTAASGELGRKILDRLAGYSANLETYTIPDYDRIRSVVVTNPDSVHVSEQEFNVSATMRLFAGNSMYRSEPIRLNGGGFPERIISINADVEDPNWSVALGREILLVGNMEYEGAHIWLYNSAFEGADTETVHGGRQSSFLYRTANQGDVVTEMTQRIPIDTIGGGYTLCGYLRTENAVNAALAARYFVFRYSTDPNYIKGTQIVDQRLQGDNDWTYLWDDLQIPDGAWFVNPRWQLHGPDAGEGHLWADDVELIRWEHSAPFDNGLDITVPSDCYYLRVETAQQVDQVTITYRTATLTN